jgi:arabinofuranan 3-O-arabinosyltransferase
VSDATLVRPRGLPLARRTRWWTAERLVLAGLTVLAAALFVRSDPGVVAPLTKPEVFLAPWRSAERYAAVWTDSANLGSPNFNIGLAPLAAVFGVLEGLGLPAWLAMRLWSTVLVVVGGWGVRRLYADLVQGTAADTAPARVAVAVAFVAAPYAVVGGGSLPTNLPYLLLPWVLVWWRRGFRRPGWGPSAAAALVLTAMSGINAGVVPVIQLVVVLPLVVHARLVDHVRWGALLSTLLRTAFLFVLTSLYWLVPSLLSLQVGTAITTTTETPGAINSVNSFAEVLRGLGMWTMYGRGTQGAFQPEYQSFVQSPLVVVGSFGLLVLAGVGARLSRSPARVLGALSVLTGAVVMVGLYPYDDPTPWGRVLGAAFDHVPGLVAFRTTNKAGGVLVLGVALLVALAVAELVPRVRRGWQRVVALAAAVAVVVLGTWPAWAGTLYEFSLPLPGYWEQAAAAVDGAGLRADQRAMIVPGIHLAAYDWGYSAPDELGNSLLEPQNVVRTTIPNGSPYAANLLGAVDQRLIEGTVPPGTVSALAERLGVGEVLARYDLSGLAPDAGAVVEGSLGADEGLGPARPFGPATRGAPSATTVRTVTGDPSVVALHPGRGAVVVDGDGAALPALVAAGLLDEDRALLWGGSLDDDALRDAVRSGARIVLTDTNQRRTWDSLDQVRVGPLLPASEDPGTTGALFTSRDQTVAARPTAGTLRAVGPGLLFGPFPEGDPRLATDGDRSTVWRFGNFSTGVGNGFVVDLDSPRPVGWLDLRAAQDGNRITAVRVGTRGPAGTWHTDVEVGPWGSVPTRVALPGGDVSTVRVEVTGVDGGSIGPVGFSEVALDGVDLRSPVVLPHTSVDTMSTWAGEDAAALESAPLDVVLHRATGPGVLRVVPEGTMSRRFALPDDRSMTADGVARVAQGAPDADLDDLAGLSAQVRARATSRAFGNPALRASGAVDGTTESPDLSTGWVPAEPVVGEALSVEFPEQELTEVTVTQPEEGAVATTAMLSLDDGAPREVELGPGRSTVDLPEPVSAHSLSLLLTGRSGEGLVRILDVGVPHVVAADGAALRDRCRPVATLDGQPLRARLHGDLADVLAGRPVGFTGCGRVALDPGDHDLLPSGPWALDDLRLRSEGREAPVAGGSATPVVEGLDRSATTTSFTVRGGCDPCWLRAGIGFDDRWTASVAGRRLGPPLVVDGYSVGWLLRAADGDRVDIEFAPTPWARTAWVVSGAAVLVCVVLALWRPIRAGRRWRR